MASIPPPPPPPPPPPELPTPASPEQVEACRKALTTACKVLEQARGQQAELEALAVFSAQLVQHQSEATVDASKFYPGIQDAWKSLSDVLAVGASGAPTATTAQQLHGPKWQALPVGRAGQWKQAVETVVFANSLDRTAAAAADMQAQRLLDGQAVLQQAVQTATAEKSVWLPLFDERLAQLQTYHARHDSHNAAAAASANNNMNNKRSHTSQQTAADGYDLKSAVHTWLRSLQEETLFSPQEVLGKYLDLYTLYEAHSVTLAAIFGPPPKSTTTTSTTTTAKATMSLLSSSSSSLSFQYIDFLQGLSAGLASTPEAQVVKLHHRKKYARFLVEMEQYLTQFLQRTAPLLSVAAVTAPAVAALETEWDQTGGTTGWQVTNGDSHKNGFVAGQPNAIDVSTYSSAAALEQAVGGDRLKTELARLGLKCGGTVSDRAKRLFLLKDTPLDKLPSKVFAKKAIASKDTAGGEKGGTTAAATVVVAVANNERRVDIARREAVVTALLGQLRPTLEATIRRTERRQTQTLKERERELEEELYGSEMTEQSSKKQKTDGDSDDSDDEDAPIYNPKNVPLDWDGKPMPYWLYKLHGLQHYYECQICGGESYRGQRNFELHFADQKHALGMKSLGISNTKHFHGVTKIDDAQQLWKSLQEKLQDKQFDGTREEEYEDSHGNVLSRTTYEDLARQGLL